MKSNVRLTLVIFLLACPFFLNLEGCDFGNTTAEEEYEKTFLRIDRMAYDFNHVADFPGNESSYLKTETDLKITFDVEFDSCLEELCKNYRLASDDNEEISADQVREALNENSLQTLEKYEEERKSFYLYKFFYWCGRLASENLVYIGDPSKEVEIMTTLKRVEFKNWQVVYGEKSDRERNVQQPYKFKWQQ